MYGLARLLGLHQCYRDTRAPEYLRVGTAGVSLEGQPTKWTRTCGQTTMRRYESLTRCSRHALRSTSRLSDQIPHCDLRHAMPDPTRLPSADSTHPQYHALQTPRAACDRTCIDTPHQVGALTGHWSMKLRQAHHSTQRLLYIVSVFALIGLEQARRGLPSAIIAALFVVMTKDALPALYGWNAISPLESSKCAPSTAWTTCDALFSNVLQPCILSHTSTTSLSQRW